jgi:hypothetical protein
VNGTCQFQGCLYGWHDLNGDQTCEYACLPNGSEICNGLDDDCNGQVDDVQITPTPVQVCGVSPVATRAECTSQVSVTCQNGAWTCGFPAGVCNPTCAAAAEVCDTLDNNCNGQFNENVSNYGQACASDAGLPYPGHGACRTTGTYVCSGANATTCSAVKANCATLPGGCTELCDGIDNDCDGLVDEPFSNKGSNATYFVKPAVTKVAASVWMYQYEASRPSATSLSAGVGNGYHTSAPAGSTLDKTYACSVQGKLPWFNVTPTEVEQTCTAMGGRICTTAEWTTACQATEAATNCTWGYAPNGGATCTSSWTATKYCNLGVSYDFDAGTTGDQDGLLVTGSPALQMCYADWTGLLGNVAGSDKIYDLTGNLREITRSAAGVFPLMGGAFNTGVENGATCTYSFYKVNSSFQLLDTGFRCCFGADPRL